LAITDILEFDTSQALENAMAETFSRASAVSWNSGYFLAALGALLFSTKGILVKLAYGDGGTPEVDAITLLALRMAFSLPFYAVIGFLGWKASAATNEMRAWIMIHSVEFAYILFSISHLAAKVQSLDPKLPRTPLLPHSACRPAGNLDV
jgi:hypothetical protein